MSAFAYGRITGLQKQGATAGADNKVITAVAALVPAEIIAAHELVLGWTTKTDAKGTTTITDADPLKWSLVVLFVLAIGLFVAGRLSSNPTQGWTRRDSLRAVIPGFALVAWTGVIGTSALSPWVGDLSKAWVGLAAIALAVVLLIVNRLITPAKPQP